MRRLGRGLVRLSRRTAILCGLAILHGMPYLLLIRLALNFGVLTSPIADAIGGQLGMRASLRDSIVGLRAQSSLLDLTLTEEGQDEPFLVAGRIDTDFNVYRYVRGFPLRRVDLSDVTLRLRFDRDGKLLTRLGPARATGGKPALVPALRVRNGKLIIDQEGRQPFALDGVSLTLEPGKPYYDLYGIIDDPNWGPLAVTGSLDPRTFAAQVRLGNDALKTSPAMLRSLPFVPAEVWQRIEVSADRAAVKFDLGLKREAPQVSYRVEFANLALGLKQEDRPTFQVARVSGTLTGDDRGLQIRGVADDPRFGRWNAEVDLLSRTGELFVSLDTPRVTVDQPRLLALPYIPRSVWEQVKVTQGETAARVRVRIPTRGEAPVRYRVDLDVRRADLRVSSLELPVRDAAGLVVVEDAQVWLRRVSGTAADGRLFGEATLDFRKEPANFRFLVEASDVRLKNLPKMWNLPAALIDGKMRVKADLSVTVRDGKPQPTGSGSARIDEARLLGFATKEPIELVLHADGQRIGFEPRSPLIRTLMNLPGVHLDPVLEPKWPVGDMVGQATGEVARMANRVIDTTSWGLNWLGGKASARLPWDQPHVDVTFALDEVDLDELFRRLAWSPPAELRLSGKLSLRVKLGVPVGSSLTELENYRVAGSVSLERLNVMEITLRNLKGQIDLRDGILTVERLAGTFGDGIIAGKLKAELFPRGDLTLSLAVRHLPVAPLVGSERGIDGLLTGEVGAAARLADLANPVAWRAQAVIRDSRIVVNAGGADRLSASLKLLGGTLSVSDLRGELGAAPLRGSGSVSLIGERAVKAELSIPGVDLSRLAGSLPPSLRWLDPAGRVDLAGTVTGTLTPLALTGGGRLRAQELRAAGLRADSLALGYRFTGNQLSLLDVEMKLYRGRINGSATLPLDGKGVARLDVAAQEIDAGALAASLKLPVSVAGKLTAAARIAARLEGGRWRGEVSAKSSTLFVQNVAVANLDASMKFRTPRVEYRLAGNALGGEVSLEGSYPPPPIRHASSHDGRLRLDRLALRGLTEALGLGERLRPLDGLASLEVPYNHDGATLKPKGEGRLVLRDVRWVDKELADDLIGYLRLSEDGVVLRDVNSSFAGGLLRVGGAYRFSNPGRSYFSLSLTGAEGERLLPLEANGRPVLAGPVNLSIRGRFGDEWTGSGTLVATRGKVAGIEVNEWRAPFEYRFVPREGQLELTVRESQAQIGTGRAHLDASLSLGRSIRLAGSVRFFDAGLKSLAGVIGDVSNYASGRVTGRIDFSGSEMSGLADLNATIQAKLRDAQALQLPVLSYLVPYLVPGQGATAFQTGELKAQLSRGVLRVKELTLENSVLLFMLQGNVTLAQTRLDLDVFARTSPLGNLDPLSLRLLLRSIPAIGPVPVGVIARTVQLIAERSVYLKVDGTLKTPVVRVEPLQTLSDEAVRFFLGQAVGVLPIP